MSNRQDETESHRFDPEQISRQAADDGCATVIRREPAIRLVGTEDCVWAQRAVEQIGPGEREIQPIRYLLADGRVDEREGWLM